MKGSFDRAAYDDDNFGGGADGNRKGNVIRLVQDRSDVVEDRRFEWVIQPGEILGTRTADGWDWRETRRSGKVGSP